MKIKLAIVMLLYCSATDAFGQQHYQLMGLVINNFLENRDRKFEQIEIIWNMQGTVQADLNDGINYLLEGKPLRAEGSLSIVLDKDPTLWQALYYRGIARKHLKNYYQALHDLKTAVKLNPKFYEAHVELAKIYFTVNSLVESENYTKRAIQIDKEKAPAYYVRGCIYEAQNKTDLAIDSFRECLKADSLYHSARINIAMNTLIARKNETTTVHELDAALTLDSLQQDALMMRSILMFEKNKQQSLQDLTRSIRVSPNNTIAYYLRGILLTSMKQFDRAFSDFQNVIKATAMDDNNFEGQQTWVDKKIDIQNVGTYTLTRIYGLTDEDAIKLKQAFCLILTGAFDKSIAILNSTSTPKQEPLTVYLRAVANEHQGKHMHALALYNEAIAIDNTIADAYKKRGIYQQELKQFEKSISDFTTVLRLMPASYVIHKIRGVSYYYNKQFDKAIDDFNIYLKHDSTNKQVMGYRGMAYLESHQRLNAYMDFANSNNDHAFNLGDMLSLVDSVLQKGDTTLALKALTSFVKEHPTFTEAYAMKIKLHVKQNDWSLIESDLTSALSNMRPDAPKQDHAYLFTIQGIRMSNTNRPEEALDSFDAAIRFDKSNAFAYLERGKFLLVRKKISKATDDLKRAATLGNSEAKKLLKELDK
jgi:tetratricopeptide (TPR) repeat protein